MFFRNYISSWILGYQYAKFLRITLICTWNKQNVYQIDQLDMENC